MQEKGFDRPLKFDENLKSIYYLKKYIKKNNNKTGTVYGKIILKIWPFNPTINVS